MQPLAEPRIFRVSEITREIKVLLEQSFPAVWIEGEVSNYRPHHSGHKYFTLKDAEAQISCVLWRTRAALIPLNLEDGLKVRLFGNIRLYEKAGRYQIDCLLIESAGVGPLQAQFEQLKKKLYDEGIFSPEHKKALPKYPGSVCIITSPTGAAVRDIISVFQRRSPATQLLIFGVKVQGEGAAEDISRAIMLANEYAGIDVIILARGGGSLEDLWAFNEEQVARAIFDSTIPIISAIGHEIDFTISDFVADSRAPTPSAAAEIAVPDRSELLQYLSHLRSNMSGIVSRKIGEIRSQLHSFRSSYALRKPEDIVYQNSIRIDELALRMNNTYITFVDRLRQQIQKFHSQLTALHPENILQRGYALIYKDEQVITSIQKIDIGDQIYTKMKDGSFNSKVKSKKDE